MIIDINCHKIEKKNDPWFIFSKADYDQKNNEFESIDWNNELHNLNTEEAWNRFKSLVDAVINRHVPKSKARKNTSKKWINTIKFRDFRKSKTVQQE